MISVDPRYAFLEALMTKPYKFTYTEGPEVAKYPSATRRQVIGESFAGRKEMDEDAEDRAALSLARMFGPPTTETPPAGTPIRKVYTERLPDEDDEHQW